MSHPAWFEILRALRRCPVGSMARLALRIEAPLLELPPELDGLKAPWEPSPPPGIARSGEAGVTWMPALGVVAWEEDPDVHADPDLLRRWSRGRLREVLHAAGCARDRGEAAAAAFAVARVRAFLARCPPGSCEHWASGMETGLRAMRLLHAAARLKEARSLGIRVPALAPLAEALALHEQALESRLDWRLHFTGNHHLVALGARLVLAATLPPHPVRVRRLRRDARAFFSELGRQVGPAGMHFESSTHYFLLVAGTAAHVVRALLSAGRTPPPSRALDAMAALALPSLLRPDGSIASVGDSDDESFLPATAGSAPPDTQRALELAAELRRPGAADPGAADPGAANQGAIATGDACRSAGSPHVGASWTRWGDGGLDVILMPGSPPLHATISSTGRGRAGTGGHGHDDATSCDLWLGGPLLGHRGTGAYAADRRLRDRLRSVASHAALQVDARSMNDPDPDHPFRQRHRAHPSRWPWFRDDRGGGLAIGHHGFVLPAPGAAVFRILRPRPGAGLLIEDHVSGAGEHLLTLRLPWAPRIVPGTPVSREDGGLELRVRRQGENADLAALRLEARDGTGRPLAVIVGHVEEGHWPRLGESVPAWTTEMRVRAPLPVVIRHDVRPLAWEGPPGA